MAMSPRSVVRTVALAAAIFAGPGAVSVVARDHDEARAVVEAGDARPLAEILDIVRGKLPGDVIRVKLERKGGHWIYEFRVVDGKGRLFEVYVDARNGEIERTKEK
jgi:uncharacterized membrane protein YkoI